MLWKIALLAVFAALLIQSGEARKAKITNIGWRWVDGAYVIHLDGSDNYDVISYKWEVATSKDGVYQEVGQSATLDYVTARGKFWFRLTVEKPNGYQLKRTKKVKIPKKKQPKAVAKMEPGGFFSMYWMDLDGTASTSGVGIASYTWTMIKGDRPGYQITPNDGLFNYLVNNPVTFQWELRVCDVWGRCDSDMTWSWSIKPPGGTMNPSSIWPKPVAVARMTGMSAGNTYTMELDGSLSDNNGHAFHEITSYKWTMVKGDNPGFKASGVTYSYSASTPGIYQWKLKVCFEVAWCDTDYTEEIEFGSITTYRYD